MSQEQDWLDSLQEVSKHINVELDKLSYLAWGCDTVGLETMANKLRDIWAKLDVANNKLGIATANVVSEISTSARQSTMNMVSATLAAIKGKE